MGGLANHELFGGSGYVDLSGALPTLGRIWGVERTREILRVIGIERLLFATDYPIFPYEAYYAVLDAMNLEEHEIAMIARENAKRMLQGLPPLVHEE